MFHWGNLSVNNCTDTKNMPFLFFSRRLRFIFRKPIGCSQSLLHNSWGPPIWLPSPESHISVSLFLNHTHTHMHKHSQLVVSSLIQFLLSAIRSGFISMPCSQSQSEWNSHTYSTVVLHEPSDWICIVFAELSNVAAPQNIFWSFSQFGWKTKSNSEFVFLTLYQKSGIRYCNQVELFSNNM